MNGIQIGREVELTIFRRHNIIHEKPKVSTAKLLKLTNEKYKILMKETEDDTKKYKALLCYYIGRFDIDKTAILHNLQI